jgi:hypothetical protein
MRRLIAIAAICTMLLIPIAGFSSNVISNGPLLIFVSFGLAYLAIPAYLLHIWPAQKSPKGKSMQDALWDGELATIEHQVSEVAQIEEVEDEGLHFLVHTSNGETLYLSGQYLYGPVERKSFPSDRVRVFTNRSNGVRYGIEPIGPLMKSWTVYESPNLETGSALSTLEDGQIYRQTIAELAAKFDLRPAKSQATSR